MTYGLLKRDKTTSKTANKDKKLTLDQEDAKKFQEDLQTLPPEASLDAYEATPVEVFGEALLRQGY